jgi:hypothetical protein
MNSIEVFKTNAKRKKDAARLVSFLKTKFPSYKISLDLEDCDKVLRVEASLGGVDAEVIIALIEENNFSCQPLG